MTFCETALAKMKQIQETMEAWSGGDEAVLSRLKNLVKASPCLSPFKFVCFDVNGDMLSISSSMFEIIISLFACPARSSPRMVSLQRCCAPVMRRQNLDS